MSAHTWQVARFTGAKTCSKCGLLPLDQSDHDVPCEPDTVDLVGFFIGDGYCSGIANPEDSPAAREREYWDPTSEEAQYCMAWIDNVPADIARQLCEGVGSTGPLGNATIGDGYDLASAAAPYAGNTIVCSEEHYSFPCPLCGDIESE